MKMQSRILADALKRTVYDRNGTIPALSHVLIESTHDGARITGSNMEMETRIEVAAEGALSVLIPAQRISSIASMADGDIEITQSDSGVVIKSSAGRFRLKTLPADDFPRKPVGEPCACWKMIGADLRIILTQVAHAMAKADARFYLNGALLAHEDGKTTVVATDGHRLAQSAVKSHGGDDLAGVILPRDAVIWLARNATDGEIQISTDKTSVTVSGEGLSVNLQAVDGRYPDWRRVIPTGASRASCTVDPALARPVLHAAGTMSNEKYLAGRFKFGPGEIQIAAMSDESEYEGACPATDSDGEAEASYCLEYLFDALRPVNGDAVELVLRGDVLTLTTPEIDGVQVVMGMLT